MKTNQNKSAGSNRIIKFRIIHENKILGYEWIDETGNWQFYTIELDTDKNGKLLRTNPGTLPYNIYSNLIRNQFTGLKDNNGGGEIYEGDLVVSEDEPGAFVVKWEDCSASFMVGEMPWPNCELIVIGNIFENPELASKLIVLE